MSNKLYPDLPRMYVKSRCMACMSVASYEIFLLSMARRSTPLGGSGDSCVSSHPPISSTKSQHFRTHIHSPISSSSKPSPIPGCSLAFPQQLKPRRIRTEQAKSEWGCGPPSLLQRFPSWKAEDSKMRDPCNPDGRSACRRQMVVSGRCLEKHPSASGFPDLPDFDRSSSLTVKPEDIGFSSLPPAVAKKRRRLAGADGAAPAGSAPWSGDLETADFWCERIPENQSSLQVPPARDLVLPSLFSSFFR
jgi:hypothetical protein